MNASAKHFLISLSLCGLFIAGSLSVGTVLAQGVPTSETPQSSPTAEVSPLAQLEQEYRQAVLNYRTAERTQTIAREQYFKLPTLAALEEAVRTTQTAMIARNKVLELYVQILQLHFSNTTGIEVTVKERQAKELSTLAQDLQTFRTAVEKTQEREGILSRAREFLLLAERMENTTTLTVSLIKFGRLQSVYDKTIAVRDEVSAEIEKDTTNALRTAEKRRGMAEINRNLLQVKVVLDELKAEMTDEKRPGQFNADQRSQELGEIYGGLSRTLTFLNEILGK